MATVGESAKARVVLMIRYSINVVLECKFAKWACLVHWGLETMSTLQPFDSGRRVGALLKRRYQHNPDRFAVVTKLRQIEIADILVTETKHRIDTAGCAENGPQSN